MTATWNVTHDWSVEIWFQLEKDEDGYPKSKNWEQLLAWPILDERMNRHRGHGVRLADFSERHMKSVFVAVDVFVEKV